MSKQALLVAILTIVAAIIWIALDVVNIQPNTKLNPKINTILTPINPNFDQKLLDEISSISDTPSLYNTRPSQSPIATPQASTSTQPSTPPLPSLPPPVLNTPAPSPNITN